MRFVFLDIDGVLNNKDHYAKRHKKYGGKFFCEDMPFNPRSIKNLRKIVDKTKAQVVVSSSWRRDEKCMTVLKARLMEYGIRVYSVTPYVGGYRGEEIKKWCKENLKLKDKIIIIDDEMYDLHKYYGNNEIVKVNCNKGLNYFKTLEAIKKLKKKK